MNNYTVTDENGRKYRRITKAAARRAYNAGMTVTLCPVNLYPFNVWHYCGIPVNKKAYDAAGSDPDFKRIVNSFEYYNCTCRETGLYTAFYIEEV